MKYSNNENALSWLTGLSTISNLNFRYAGHSFRMSILLKLVCLRRSIFVSDQQRTNIVHFNRWHINIIANEVVIDFCHFPQLFCMMNNKIDYNCSRFYNRNIDK